MIFCLRKKKKKNCHPARLEVPYSVLPTHPLVSDIQIESDGLSGFHQPRLAPLLFEGRLPFGFRTRSSTWDTIRWGRELMIGLSRVNNQYLIHSSIWLPSTCSFHERSRSVDARRRVGDKHDTLIRAPRWQAWETGTPLVWGIMREREGDRGREREQERGTARRIVVTAAEWSCRDG